MASTTFDPASKRAKLALESTFPSAPANSGLTSLEEKVNESASRMFDLDDEPLTAKRVKAEALKSTNGIQIDPASESAKSNPNISHIPRELFPSFILPFLKEKDLVAAAQTCWSLNEDALLVFRNKCEEDVNRKVQPFCEYILGQKIHVRNIPTFAAIREEFFTKIPGISKEKVMNYKKKLTQYFVDKLFTLYEKEIFTENEWASIYPSYIHLIAISSGGGEDFQLNRLSYYFSSYIQAIITKFSTLRAPNKETDLWLSLYKTCYLYASKEQKESQNLANISYQLLERLLSWQGSSFNPDQKQAVTEEKLSDYKTAYIEKHLQFFLKYDPMAYLELLTRLEQTNLEMTTILLSRSKAKQITLTKEERGKAAIFAAEECSENVVMFLLENAEELSNSDCHNILDEASANGLASVVRLLLNRKPILSKELYQYSLSTATSCNQEAVVFEFLNPHTGISEETLEKRREIVLVIASSQGREAILRRLLISGMPFSASPWENGLVNAAQNGHEKIARLLLINSSTLSRERFEASYKLAFRYAITNGHAHVIRLLLQYSDLVSKETVRHVCDSGLELASFYRQEAIVSLLKENTQSSTIS